jgi:hypothetical protein
MKTYDKHRELMMLARYHSLPDDILQAFEDTIRHRSKHVPDVHVPALKPSRRLGPPLKFGVIDYAVRVQDGVEQTIVTLVTRECTTTLVVRDDEEFHASLHTLMFPIMKKEYTWFCPDGKERFIRYFKTSLMKGLAAHGYHVSGTRINSPDTNLRVSKDNCHWWIADYNACHQATLSGTSYDATILDTTDADHQTILTRFYEEICAVQEFYKTELGVSMKRTAASSGMAVFRSHMPDGSCLSRPSPQIFAVCREGGLLRQGYIQHENYLGLASEEDQRRQYTSLLADNLPQHFMLGHAVSGGQRQKGLFLCRVSGQGMFPIHIGSYSPLRHTFEREYWNGGSVICWLADTEYEGIERAGYTIDPIFGYVIDEWFSVRSLVEKLQMLTDIHDPKSATGQVLKLIGNGTIGKFSSQSAFHSYVYSTEDQKDLYPMQDDETGKEIPNVWQKESKVFMGHQQPALAARLYGATRTLLYLRMAEHIEQGRRVVHACTDGLIVVGSLGMMHYSNNPRFGQWRLEQNNVPTSITGSNKYVIGTKEKNMGAGSMTLTREAIKSITVASPHTEPLKAPTASFLSDLYKAVVSVDLRTTFVTNPRME